jgi:short-subunit dehydrogenase
MNVAGSRALVTGATGGIGHAIARALAGAGADVVVSGRRAEVLEALAAEIGAEVIAADLACREDVVRLAQDAGAVDILVANAGLSVPDRLNAYDLDETERAIDVNLGAPIMLTHELLPPMVERGRGHFVYISSVSGKVATPSPLYSATKFGLRGFGQGLRKSLRGSGVGVSVLFPGFIRDAGMFHDAGVELPGYVGTSAPEDVAASVLEAVERDRGEVVVAPVSVRVGVKLSELAPQTAARLNRRLGEREIAERFAERYDVRP